MNPEKDAAPTSRDVSSASPRSWGRVRSHAEFLAARRFDRLDGLRAVSILLVFTAHPAYRKFWPHFHGQTGVSIFFVLSGFLITTLLAREQDKYGSVSLVAFYIRRLFRIYPLYFAVLAFYCVLILGLGLQPDRRSAFASNIPYYILFLPEHAFFGNNGGVLVPYDGSWSIGIEEKFYLVWPLLGFVLLGAAFRLRLASLFVLALALSGAGMFADWGRWVAPYALISFGALVALALHSARSYRLASVLGRPIVLLGVGLVMVLMQFGTSLILPGQSLYLVYGVVVALFLAGVVMSTAPWLGWLQSRVMVYLGQLSYAVYLIHNFNLNFAERLVPSGLGLPGSLLSTGLAFVATIVIAHFVHRWFEDPLRLFGVRLASGRRPAASLPTVVE